MSAAEPSQALGLSVKATGTLIRNGRPYRGIGVNYYDAFLRVLRNPNDDSYREGFQYLGRNHIPFARFAAGGYTGSDLELYVTDKGAYFRRLDAVVHCAEEFDVGLIATLFWSIGAVSQLVNETPARWGESNSKTREFMRNYTREVVARYANSPAIWGWEFSCELSLPFDLPNRPSGFVLGRKMTFATFKSAALDFARTVRGIDSRRILLTGNSLPRASAYNNSTNGSFTPDSEQQFASMLLRDNPGPYNPICIHTSPASISRYFADRKVSYKELLEACVKIGRSAGKAIYLEEFVPIPARPAGRGSLSEREYFATELSAIERSGVPIASVWVYDRKLSPDRSNLTFTNERAYMLKMIAELNRKFRAQSSTASIATH
ncbi:hypothetical protein BH20VER3_BH20VER3_08520 [soil metagenome]